MIRSDYDRGYLAGILIMPCLYTSTSCGALAVKHIFIRRCVAGKALPSNLSYSIAYLASVGEVMSLGGVVVSWRICPGAAIVAL